MKRCVFFFLSVCCIGVFSARAAVSPAFEAVMKMPVEELVKWDFEDKVPGMVLRGRSGCKDRGDVIDVVSNAEAVSGKHSLLIDQSRLEAGEGQGYYYVECPKITKGVAVFSFCFRLEEGSQGIEIRTSGKAWISHTIGLGETVTSWSCVGGGATFARTTRYTWYRMTLWMSAPENAHHTWGGRLDMQAADGTWQLGEAHEFPTDKQVLDGAFTSFDFNGGMSKVYFDDIVWGVIREAEL